MLRQVARRSYDFNVGAKRAREARAALGEPCAAPLRCVVEAVEALGVPVVVGALREGIAGAYQHRGAFRVVFVDSDMSAGRQRFTLAHELGHLRCGHDGGHHVDTSQTLGGAATTSFEVQANAFASEFLMPKAAVHEDVPAGARPTLEDVVVLAARYGTSALAALIRLRDCGRVSDGRFDRLRAEIDAGDHLTLAGHLGLAWPDDVLAGLDEPPYLSPSLASTALGAVIRGECTVEEAAGAAGVSPDALGAAVEVLLQPARG